MIYIVMGAPRTGTSLMAGMLHKGGDVLMGWMFNPPQDANPTGFYEDYEFIIVNEALLRIVGGNWKTPPPDEEAVIELRGQWEDEIRSFFRVKEEYDLDQWEERPHWGIKDHRMYLLLPLYEPVLTEHECHFIIMHRNPLATAASFLRVWPDQFVQLASALELIAEYQLRIVQFLQRGHILLESEQWHVTHVAFEQLIDSPDEACGKLEAMLGVHLAREHLDPKQRHF